MIIKFITIAVFIFFVINLSAQDNIITIQENINLRALESITSQNLEKLPQLSKVTMISEGKIEVVNGISDRWYKVETDKNKIGYVFGHYTSLKKEGQRKVIATFTDCSMGDLYHIEFDNGTYDFGGAQNNLGKYDLCGEDDMGNPVGNPKYVNKKFELTVNDLFSQVCCDPSCEETCIEKVPTIVEIKELLDKQTEINTSCINGSDYLTPFSFKKTTFKNLDIQGNYKIIKKFISEDFVLGSDYEYAFSIDLNDDKSDEYIFVNMIPQHGPIPVSVISKIYNQWSEIFIYDLYEQFENSALWGLFLLKSKTNGFYDFCFEGIKYKFNGNEYVKE